MWLDRILVYDGPNDQSILIGELFGTPNHKVVKSISSTRKTMFIDFKKTSKIGQTLDWTVEFIASIKYNKISPDCQSWLESNILMSPNNANFNCSWLITRKLGSYITLDFSFIEVKPLNVRVKKH